MLLDIAGSSRLRSTRDEESGSNALYGGLASMRVEVQPHAEACVKREKEHDQHEENNSLYGYIAFDGRSGSGTDPDIDYN